MAGCTSSICKILNVAASLTLMLPGLALGEFGVCPPYSKTFGPEDPPAEILAFVDEINARPGGGTVVFEPGHYEGLVNGVSIRGVVCMRSSSVGSDGPTLFTSATGEDPDVTVLRVETGAMLTTQSVSLAGPPVNLHVAAGATLIAADAGYSFRIVNHGAAYLDNVGVGSGGIENHGMLKMTGGYIAGVSVFSLNDAEGLINKSGAYAILERVSLRDNNYVWEGSAYGTGVRNEGVLTLVNSMAVDNGDRVFDCQSTEPCQCGGVGIANSGTAYVIGSTIARNPPQGGCGTGISNTGYIEVSQSIVAENSDGDCNGSVADLGYNVFGDDSCPITETTSIQADPNFLPDSVELAAGSLAIDRIPLELCSDTDALGRSRTDGDNDGIVACDSGALEYGYAALPVTVRTTPYWQSVGTLDLTRQTALFVSVFSTADVDATDILMDTIEVEGLEQRALRGPALTDANRDGYLDIAVWYRLDRMPPLVCGRYDQRFEAMTDDGRLVTGQLRFEVVGCAP